MPDRVPGLLCVALCKHCRKAIATGEMWDDWLHFTTHDGHYAEPMDSVRASW